MATISDAIAINLGLPGRIGFTCVNHSYNSKTCVKSYGYSLAARALFVAQIVASLVAIPITLIAGLFASVVKLCTDRKQAGLEFKDAFRAPALCLRFALECLYFTIAPLKCGTKQEAENYNRTISALRQQQLDAQNDISDEA